MTIIQYESPLKIPEGTRLIPQNQRSYDHGFPPTLGIMEALRAVEDEVRAIAPERARIFTNQEHINQDRLRKTLHADSGVCLELKLQQKLYHIVSAKWPMVQYNLYALHLALRNWRNNEKWGIGTLTNMLQGYSSVVAFDASSTITSAATNGNHAVSGWMQVLGLGPTATIEDANAVYRNRAKLVAGDADAMLKLNEAIEQARRSLQG